jgi:hypothetical protein
MGIFRIKRFSSNERKEKLYFLRDDGTAFTGEDLNRSRVEVLGQHRNGTYRVKGNKPAPPRTPSPENLTREAYIKERLKGRFNGDFEHTLNKLEKQGLIKNVNNNIVHVNAPGKTERKLAKAVKSVSNFLKKRLR